jgi:hypothetical protein
MYNTSAVVGYICRAFFKVKEGWTRSVWEAGSEDVYSRSQSYPIFLFAKQTRLLVALYFSILALYVPNSRL